jgi:hypothetical protein
MNHNYHVNNIIIILYCHYVYMLYGAAVSDLEVMDIDIIGDAAAIDSTR